MMSRHVPACIAGLTALAACSAVLSSVSGADPRASRPADSAAAPAPGKSDPAMQPASAAGKADPKPDRKSDPTPRPEGGNVPAAKPGIRPDAKVPDGVTVIRDLEYARVGEVRLLLDLWKPADAKGPLPVIVGIHGGAWISGSKAGGQGSWLARHGYAVAVINYRLSGVATFPAQIEDCKAAVRWLRANADKYGLDPARFGATGHSAGGHLTSMLAVTGDVKDFDKGDHLDRSSRIQAAVPSAGPTDLLQMGAQSPPDARIRHDSPDSPESRLIGGAIQEHKEKAARANPIKYVGKDDPPFLIIHGDADPTVPYGQATLLFDALKSAGVPVHLHTVKGGGHGIGGREVNDRVLAFFDRHLKATGKPAGEPAAPTAETSESKAAANPAQPGTGRPMPPVPAGITWDRVRQREDADNDGKVTRTEWKGPAPLFDRLDRNRDGVLTKDDFDPAPGAPETGTPAPKPGA